MRATKTHAVKSEHVVHYRTDWKSLCQSPKTAPKVAVRVANFHVRKAGIDEEGIDFSHPKQVGVHTAEQRAAHFDVHGDLHETYTNSPFMRELTARVQSLVKSAGPRFRARESLMPHFSLGESEEGKDKQSLLTFKIEHLSSESQIGEIRSAFERNAGDHELEFVGSFDDEIKFADSKTGLLMRLRFHVELGLIGS